MTALRWPPNMIYLRKQDTEPLTDDCPSALDPAIMCRQPVAGTGLGHIN